VAEASIAGHPDAFAVFEKILTFVKALGPFELRVTRSRSPSSEGTVSP